ncbi:MAG: RNA polymerase sigma-70 factor [Prolixibacteraceae bacterium]|jgi:RNA polymerase sigma-70 factor (ECF subfamily)
MSLNQIRLNKDEDLLLRIKKGDEVAFELVFYKYKGKLYDFIRRSLPANEDAESMVQEIFVKLWSNREQLNPAKSLNAFLYTIARNEIFGHLRKLLVRRKYFEELSFSLKESSETTDWQIEYNELKSIVDQLISSMPEKRREIYILSRNEGLSYKEISAQLGISENTVDTQIRKALAFLKENLKRKMSLVLFFLPFHKKKN